MKIKKIVEILCAAAFLFTVGCAPADNASSSDSAPSKPEDNTVYEEIPEYPKYSDVDMQGYTFRQGQNDIRHHLSGTLFTFPAPQ